jgi:HSP20 family molecular chaperone IbpA
MEDMLALDSLSNLTLEDRTSRKKAISEIEKLLSSLDTAKVKLNNFRKDIETKVSEQMPENTSPNPVRHGIEEPKTLDRPAKKAARMMEEPIRTARPKQNLVAMPQVPGRELWEQMELPVKFHAHEQRRCYVVEAKMPSLDMKDVDLRLSPDRSRLIIEGVCLPNPAQTSKMQRVVASHLEQIAQMSPEKFADFGGASALGKDAFIRIGQGHFGSFSQAFSIPDDVVIGNIEASHDNGKLIVVFPKREPEMARMTPSAYGSYGMADPFHEMSMPMHSTAKLFAANPFHRMGMSF